ncbi:MAG TPA: TetR/AcrR family transcriptional regulator [Lacipirellulaceae bacterium]|jgi:AcrR family transcriptional regulator
MAVGRPRGFDTDQALERALKVFWRKGYEGTTLPDLTEAMDINRPSLYAAFGNKEALFRKVLDRYADGPAAYVREALEEPTARRVAERLLLGAVDLVTNPRHPGGCLAVHGALACGDEAQSIRRELIARRVKREAALRQRFQRAKSEGDLSASASPADLARYITTIVQGLAVQAASGASRNELQRVAKTALRAWPK